MDDDLESQKAAVSNSAIDEKQTVPESKPSSKNGSTRSRVSSRPQSRASSRAPSTDNGSRHSTTSSRPQSVRSSRRQSRSRSTIRPDSVADAASSEHDFQLDDEEVGLFDFAEELRQEKPPGEPWFMEMTRLRRLHFLWLNRELAAMRKKILQDKRASNEDMRKLQDLLRDQAEAIRNFQYVKSLDYLSAGQMEQRRRSSIFHFPHTAHSVDTKVDPFLTEEYRVLPRAHKTAIEPFSDEVREFMRTYLPSRITWTTAEREAKPDYYSKKYAPNTLSPSVDRLARFTIAMAGALFILVPMYIMAINQSQNKNLVTTTVAVVLFALLCSVTLRTSNDQTLGATAGYAAVLMVFVGLTSAPGE